MISKKHQNIIIKYLNKQASKKELEALENWLDEDKKHKKHFKNFVKVNFLIDLNTKKFDSKASEKKLLGFISKEKKVIRLHTLKTFMKYAAGVAILVAVSYFYFNSSTSTIDKKTIPSEKITLILENGNVKVIDENGTFSIQDPKGNIVGNQKGNKLVYENNNDNENLSYNTLKVPYGKRFAVLLSDGTKVTLNAGTSLKYPVKFLKGQNRQVFIETGEAYFEVAKDETHPFVVNSNQLNVRVLGTKFNVSAYPEDASVSTVLVEGSVSLYSSEFEYDANKATYLKPGFKADWNKDAQTTNIQKADIELYTAWIDGKIILKHMKFSSIIKKLERHYNVEIYNNDEAFDEELITATFDTETIEEVLEVINEIHTINYKINKNKILITKVKK